MVFMRILYLLPALTYGGAARQALLLARGLAGQCDLRICLLYEEGPWANELRGAGAVVTSLDWQRSLDPRPLWRLRGLLRRFAPAVVHVWGTAALRSLAVCGCTRLSQCIASRVAPSCHWRPGACDRWLLRQSKQVVAEDTTDAHRLMQQGIARISVIPPGTDTSRVARGDGASASADRLSWQRGPCQGLSRSGACRGFPGLPFSRCRILPDRRRPGAVRFEALPRRGVSPRAHAFAGCQGRCRRLAGQRHGLLGAKRGRDRAAGRPGGHGGRQAGHRLRFALFPRLIRDGDTGLLVPPGDARMLAQQTRRLFLDDSLARRLGTAARQWVSAHFTSQRFVDRHRELYGLTNGSAEKISLEVRAAPVANAAVAARQEAACQAL